MLSSAELFERVFFIAEIFNTPENIKNIANNLLIDTIHPSDIDLTHLIRYYIKVYFHFSPLFAETIYKLIPPEQVNDVYEIILNELASDLYIPVKKMLFELYIDDEEKEIDEMDEIDD